MNFFQLLSVDTITDIAKMLDQKSLCRLIMSSKEFKQLCDTNDIWKYHYLLTLKSKWKITENSIHSKYNRHYYQYQFIGNDGTMVKINSYDSPNRTKIYFVRNNIVGFEWKYRTDLEFLRIVGENPYITSLWSSRRIDDYIISCGCMKKQYDLIKRSGIVQSRQENQSYKLWEKDLTIKWKKLNEENGLQNLCQNPEHYVFETLEMPESCKGYKNYKKMIIKKLYTKCKSCKEEKKYISKNVKLDREMERLRKRYEQLEKEKKMNEDSIVKSREKLDRLKDAIDIV